MERQPGDAHPMAFSFLNTAGMEWAPAARQVACFGTRTTEATEALVFEAMTAGRVARFQSGHSVSEGGCREPRCATLPYLVSLFSFLAL